MLYGYGRQDPIIAPSLNDLNLLHNPFNILGTIAVMQTEPTTHDKNYSPQSPEPSELMSISTPLMNLSTIGGWETPHTTTDDNTFYSEDEPRKIYWEMSSTRPCSRMKIRERSCYNNAPHLHRRPQAENKAEHGDVLSKKKGECCSMSVRHVGKFFQQKRTSRVPLRSELRLNIH